MADMNGNGKNGQPANACAMCGGSGAMMNGACGGYCGWHGCGGRHFGWRILRVIIVLILLGVVFSVGVMVGELRGLRGGAFGRFPMRANYGGQGYYPMGGQGATLPAPSSTTSR
jgi:hypothetical protein